MASASRAARQTPETSTPGRGKMIAAIQITWKQIRLDLHGDEEALRAERLAFITDALKLKRPVESLRDLSTPQLARVLDAMRRFQSQPRLEGYAPPVKAEPAREEAGANVVHLASAEQVFTINNLLTHLDWTREYQEDFLHRRFGRKNPAHMRPPQAQSLTRILLNIACTRELKKRGVKKVSRAMIREEIPYLKASLGIDRRHQATDTDEGGNTWQ